MIDKLRILQAEQMHLSTVDEKLKEYKDEYEANITRIKEVYEYNNVKKRIELLKAELTELGKQHFAETKEKKLVGGLGIREVTTYEYNDKTALDWAKTHQLCLKLDDKAFKDLAKTQDFDFVTESKKVTVTFPKEIKLED